MRSRGTTVLILGIGNLLWADEGFGVRAVEELHRAYEFDDDVRVMDGGTQGIYLVQHIRETDILIVFDAIDYGLPPGTLKRVEGERGGERGEAGGGACHARDDRRMAGVFLLASVALFPRDGTRHPACFRRARSARGCRCARAALFLSWTV